ncbi:uncharacterized protein F4812DRAFT_359832 [Daldinia caldariorum]|uniref:uncharacterized protein n=1 Tax=Daldinia caldariorum TaxID=326644 RepID=UPI0020084FB9|nr:uncharacterized protein F4812DRAFT_359832 [Daldinia caldariorum]KAI1468243.1 hypothetical protein F4812DRAFT_359832 [Daldinia caldariorum]
MQPPLQVRDLPSSASFYAAIVQPLKLRYISANSSSIVFGDSTSGTPVLEVKKLAPGQHLRPSRAVLSAQSPSVVSAFRTAALRAEPDIQIDTYDDGRVEVTDLDGNIIEVVCSAGYRSSFTRANSSASMPSRSEPRAMVKRSATTTGVEPPPPPRETSGPFGAGSSMGTVLGAAAVGVAVGSALTYAFMSNGRQRNAQRQEYDAATHRRASYSDPHANAQPRYAEDKKYPPLSYGARYAQIEAPPARSRAADDLDDRASRHSSHYTTASRSRRLSEASTRRPPTAADVEYISNVGSKYEQKLLMDREYRSQVGEDDRRSYAPSKYSAAPSKHTATPSRYAGESEYRARSSSKHRAPRQVETETYVSTRSKRAPPPAAASAARPPSRSHSRISARDLELPASRVGWDGENGDDDDDDVESIAPEDSISCVGDEGYKRTRRHMPPGTPSMVGRFRRVVNEFDGKRRPLYGSEVN